MKRKTIIFLLFVILIGCTKKQEGQSAPGQGIRVEYGFDMDTNEFVVHNIMNFPLTETRVSLDIYRDENHYSTLISDEANIEPDYWFYPVWDELKDGKTTHGTTFPLAADLKIKRFTLLCNEGDIDEEFKDPDKMPVLQEWQKNNNRLAAYVMMQEYVKQSLKAPATAKFGRTIDTGVLIIQGENYIYTIESYVDAQNEYGAMLRTYFSGEIQQIGEDEWLPLSLEFWE
jgi:hypothetical protein